MYEASPRKFLRDRILNDLKATIKQIYQESVKEDVSSNKKAWLCQLLVKYIDQILRHGLKNLQNGYWGVVKNIIHPLSLELITQLPIIKESHGSLALHRGTTWITLALNDGCLDNYLESIIRDECLTKYYEEWAVVKNYDSAQRFLSLICGLDNIEFQFEIDYLNEPPKSCSFKIKQELTKKPKELTKKLTSSISTSSLSSPVDSGVVFADSESDLEHLPDLTDAGKDDIINGNIPTNVVLRKQSREKNVKKRVSFHEECKSPEKCRRLKWDCEKLRYSWSGESDISCYKNNNLTSSSYQENYLESDVDIGADVKEFTHSKSFDDSYISSNFFMERGVPEGEESPVASSCLHKKSNIIVFDEDNRSEVEKDKLALGDIKTQNKSIIVKRFLQSIRKQKKIRKLRSKLTTNPYPLYIHIQSFDKGLIHGWNQQINAMIQPIIPRHIPQRLELYIDGETIFKYFFIYRKLIILTDISYIIVNMNDNKSKRINYENISKIVIYPNYHFFIIFENINNDIILNESISGDQELTEEIIGGLEYCMRINGFDLPFILQRHVEDLKNVKKMLVDNYVLSKCDELIYYGNVFMDEESRPNTPDYCVKQGMMMFKILNQNDSWKPAHFILQNGELSLILGEPTQPYILDLTRCQSCQRTYNQDRPHTFELIVPTSSTNKNTLFTQSQKMKTSKFSTSYKINSFKERMSELINLTTQNLKLDSNVKMNSLVFAAPDEYELSDWLQAILQVSGKDHDKIAETDTSALCSVVISSTSLITFKESFTPSHDIDVTTSASISDLISFQTGYCRGNCFCVMEFNCMEAASTTGDVILYFKTKPEMDRFERHLASIWPYYTPFPSSLLLDDNKISHCCRTIDQLFHAHDNFIV